jgi:hypothetical protein
MNSPEYHDRVTAFENTRKPCGRDLPHPLNPAAVKTASNPAVPA